MEGSERNPNLTYPDEQYVYYFCAKEFGWTPLEVDEQPAYLMDWILAIANMIGEVNEDKQQPLKRD